MGRHLMMMTSLDEAAVLLMGRHLMMMTSLDEAAVLLMGRHLMGLQRLCVQRDPSFYILYPINDIYHSISLLNA